MDNNNKLHLFTSILIKILKCESIPKECFKKPNKFQTILREFIGFFYVELDTNIEIELGRNICQKIVKSLQKIEQKLLSTDSKKVQYSLFNPRLMISTTDIRNLGGNISENESISSNDTTTSLPRNQSNDTKSKSSPTKSLYDVFVPFNQNWGVKYQFQSFNPLIVKQISVNIAE